MRSSNDQAIIIKLNHIVIALKLHAFFFRRLSTQLLYSSHKCSSVISTLSKCTDFHQSRLPRQQFLHHALFDLLGFVQALL